LSQPNNSSLDLPANALLNPSIMIYTIVIVIVVEFTVESRGSNDSGCFKVEVWTNTE